MKYDEALAWVHGLKRVVAQPGLARMKELMAALGNPQRRLRFVHVAGTNGKGSTVVMLAAILHKAGYTVGANISPYVLDFRERFQVNGEMVPPEEVAAALARVRKAAEAMAEAPIEFEAVTAAALVLFAARGCDIVCLEAGIGGRTDSTNVIEDTLVACITQIGLDHTELLGGTLEEIAAEKCGIFKNECDVVCYPAQPPEALAVVESRAKQARCPLVVPSMEDIHFYRAAPFENRINYGGYDLRVPFPGLHQARNAAVAVEAALALWRKGWHIEDEHIVEGIGAARIPARIEVLGRRPLVIVDGAHNEDSAKALAATLLREKAAGFTAVMGVLRDKQAPAMLAMLAPYIETLYAVAPASPRALPADELAALARPMIRHSYACDSVAEALALAAEDEAQAILVCGSLYLAAEARAVLLGGASYL